MLQMLPSSDGQTPRRFNTDEVPLSRAAQPDHHRSQGPPGRASMTPAPPTALMRVSSGQNLATPSTHTIILFLELSPLRALRRSRNRRTCLKGDSIDNPCVIWSPEPRMGPSELAMRHESGPEVNVAHGVPCPRGGATLPDRCIACGPCVSDVSRVSLCSAFQPILPLLLFFTSHTYLRP